MCKKISRNKYKNMMANLKYLLHNVENNIMREVISAYIVFSFPEWKVLMIHFCLCLIINWKWLYIEYKILPPWSKNEKIKKKGIMSFWTKSYVDKQVKKFLLNKNEERI